MPSLGLQDSKEKSPALPLTLTTLAGEDIAIVLDPREHDNLHNFENAVLEQLPHLGSNSTFGCELQFVQKDTHEVLTDSIRDTLRANQRLYVIARQCFVEAAHKGQLKGEVRAICVPCGKNDKIPPQAFSFHTEVRHVQVEAGIRIVGEAAWRSCQRLQIVHLPDTVVSLRHGAFRRCYVLRAVTAPGCKHFGIKVFEECCALNQIGTTRHPDNPLAPQAQLRPRAFERCTALRHLSMDKAEYDPAHPTRSLPECCFLEAGIVTLSLPPDFNWVGPAACARCQQLQIVDLSQTGIIEILGSTFAHCSQLQQLSLSWNLRTIEQEAFLHQCASLQEICIPPSLLYIARRAFAGCAQLRVFRRMGKSKTWRGTYARVNAFDKCEQLGKPTWLRFLPPNAEDQWREEFREATP